MIGRKIHHYQILEKLGEGGMGVVYKADDTKLHRTVALKFLSPQIVGNPAEQERLISEARAAAGLSHPNICTIYEINEFDGQTFMAMEYVEGSTLRDRVLSDHIGIDEALRYAVHIGKGLKRAHDKDIIHRDIKSANIMINAADKAVIMDFGLARRAGQKRKDERVSSGGTSAYMSPEQARGEGVDQRTDIWSLGVVLYEMVCGQLPFRGDYEQAVIYSILNEGPRPVEELRRDAPADVVRLINRCLEKEPADRFQTLDELIDELERVRDRVSGRRRPSGASAGGGRRAVGIAVAAVVTIIAAFLVYDLMHGKQAGSEVRVPIAVIDFVNDTDEPALDGLSGMLITSLEQSRRLSVMTRTAMFDILTTLGRDDVDRISESVGQEICRAANVGALAIPTVRRFGDLYTIDLKVLDTRTNKYIFTTKEEGQGQESIPAMIDKIARDIRIDLREEDTESVDDTRNVASATTVNLEAYQKYFEGERLLNDLQLKKAQAAFQRAVELDSTFALAYYRLAYTEWWSRGQFAEAGEHIRVALDNLDRLPRKERFLVRALSAGLTEGFDAQIPIFKEMRQLFPDNKEMLFGLGDAEFHSFNYDSAAVHFERVLELDPEFDRALQHLTWTYHRTGRAREAREVAERWVAVTGSGEAVEYLARVEFDLGNADEALRLVRGAEAEGKEPGWMRQREAEILLSTGRHEEVLELLARQMSGADSVGYRIQAARTLAEDVYPYLGRFRDAERMYEAAIANPDSFGIKPKMLPEIYLGRATLRYWAREDVDAMVREAEKALELPDTLFDKDFWQGMSMVRAIAGDVDAAKALRKEHLKDMPPMAGAFFDVLFDAFAGDCDEARAGIDSLTHGMPQIETAQVEFAIGYCQIRNGQYTEAIHSLERVVAQRRIDLNSAVVVPLAHLMLAEAYEHEGDVAKARTHYERLLEIWRDADDDLPALREARDRLDALVAASSG